MSETDNASYSVLLWGQGRWRMAVARASQASSLTPTITLKGEDHELQKQLSPGHPAVTEQSFKVKTEEAVWPCQVNSKLI